eukprot:gene26641-35316_t
MTTLMDALASFLCPLPLDVTNDPVFVQTSERTAWLVTLKSSIDIWKARTDRALRALNHREHHYYRSSAKREDVHRGLLLGKPMAVCVLKGPADAVDRRCAGPPYSGAGAGVTGQRLAVNGVRLSERVVLQQLRQQSASSTAPTGSATFAPAVDYLSREDLLYERLVKGEDRYMEYSAGAGAQF